MHLLLYLNIVSINVNAYTTTRKTDTKIGYESLRATKKGSSLNKVVFKLNGAKQTEKAVITSIL